MANLVRLEIQGTEYSLDLDDLTLGEMEEAAQMGATMQTTPDGNMHPTFLRFLMIVMKRNAGEVVTPEATKEIKLSQIRWLEVPNGGPPPKRAQRRGGKRGAQETTRA